MKFLGWLFIPYIMIFIRWKKIGVIKRVFAISWIAIILLIAISLSVGDSQPTVAPEQPSATHTPTITAEPGPRVTPSLNTTVPTPSSKPIPTVTIKPASKEEYDFVLHFPASKYPETAAHIQAAIKNGKSAVCTIDRPKADDNRDASLTGIPTKNGFDRDEWPMAMCDEGGAGADIAYVTSSDNRGSGSWVGNHLEEYSNGTRVLFIIDGTVSGSVLEVTKSGTGTSVTTNKPSSTPEEDTSDVFYANCAAVRNAGKAPLHKGDPGYSLKLDRDKDGVACE
jgi:hypothetical protein